MRLDLQGLRALAVGLVVLNHAFEWPAGGFVGVDIFFVISGFLMTSVLHREFERSGRIRFLAFYRRRIRRLIPASVAVLAATVLGAWALFTSGRFVTTVWDAIASLFFVSNWRYAAAQTDYFAQGARTSPLQHYWSLSLEEQYYLVWPLAILLIALLVGRTRHPRVFAALITLAVTAGLFVVSLMLTQVDLGSAYFITPARLWELSVGATVALCMPWFLRSPLALRPFIALMALAGMITASVITPSDHGFPAPWALVAVLSTAAFIAFPWQPKRSWLNPLDNPFLSYIGDISYSLYLWHFPALILVAELSRGTPGQGTPIPALEAIALALVLAAFSYRFIEEPVRHSSWLEGKKKKRRSGSGRTQRIRLIAVTAVTACVVAVVAAAFLIDSGPRSGSNGSQAAPPAASGGPSGAAALTALTAELTAALEAKSWPELTPSMETAVTDYKQDADVLACGTPAYPGMEACTWGAADASTSVAIVGDSTSMAYVPMLRALADSSNGHLKVTSLGMFGCPFVDIATANSAASVQQGCPAHKTQAIENIGTLKPDVLFITNTYTPYKTVSGENVTQDDYKAGLQSYLSRIAPGTGKIVLLAPPPADKDVRECYTPQSSPSDCVTSVPKFWQDRSAVEEQLAASVDGLWLDTRPLFCVRSRCPAFAGASPTKFDQVHITEEYARHIAPAASFLLASKGIELTDSGAGGALPAVKSEITASLAQDGWPELTPSMDAVVGDFTGDPEANACAEWQYPGVAACTWGPASPSRKVAIVGDSTSSKYVPMLRALSDAPGGGFSVTSFSTNNCPFVDIETETANAQHERDCAARKALALQEIAALKPNVLIITNSYLPPHQASDQALIGFAQHAQGVKRYIEKLKGDVGEFVLLAPPPADKDVRECYSARTAPKACVSKVTSDWTGMAAADSKLAGDTVVWIDSRPLFCDNGNCPAFAAGMPIKFDRTHITPEYSRHIAPAFAALLAEQRVDLASGG